MQIIQNFLIHTAVVGRRGENLVFTIEQEGEYTLGKQNKAKQNTCMVGRDFAKLLSPIYLDKYHFVLNVHRSQ